METNWIVVAMVLAGVIALILFLNIQNLKDKNDLISALNAQEFMKVLNEVKKDTEEI